MNELYTEQCILYRKMQISSREGTQSPFNLFLLLDCFTIDILTWCASSLVIFKSWTHFSFMRSTFVMKRFGLAELIATKTTHLKYKCWDQDCDCWLTDVGSYNSLYAVIYMMWFWSNGKSPEFWIRKLVLDPVTYLLCDCDDITWSFRDFLVKGE